MTPSAGPGRLAGRRRRIAGPLLLCGVLDTASASGQGTQAATVTGFVGDAEGRPVAGAAVTAESPSLLGQRSTTT